MSKLTQWVIMALTIVVAVTQGAIGETATLDVCPSGCTYSSIQAAIDDAVSGVDDVLVGDGVYVENINFNGKAITVQSVNGATNTIIDGNANGSVVQFASSEGTDSVLDGFTITNGSGTGGNGGGIYCFYYSPSITNCTISGNTANGNGGGIYVQRSSPMVVNSILWGDSPDEIDGSGTITYSDIQGGWSGIGNIDADPLFVGGGNYHLTANSPCIDTGTSIGAPADDIDNDARPQGIGYDMGSDEYVAGVPPAAPSRLRVRAISRRKIRLRWRDNSDNEDGFVIERKRGGCRSSRRWREIATVPANTTRYVNRGLRPNTKYSYRVRAYNSQGDSGYSNCRAAKTLP